MPKFNRKSIESLRRTRKWQIRQRSRANIIPVLSERFHHRFNPNLSQAGNGSSASSDEELILPRANNEEVEIEMLPDNDEPKTRGESNDDDNDMNIISGSDPNLSEESDISENHDDDNNIELISGSDPNSSEESVAEISIDSESSGHQSDSASTDTSANQQDDLLYDEAPITVKESMLSLLTLLLTQNLSDPCFSIILTIVSKHIPTINHFNGTLHKFWKYFESGNTPMIRHLYCTKCLKLIQFSNDICQCEVISKRSYFIEMPIIKQLENFYVKPEFLQDLNYRFQPNRKENAEDITDVYDGILYEKYSASGKLLSNPNNISFTWYTDGAPVFKSKNFSIWPVFLIINELPYKKRVKKENIIVAVLWFGENKPIPNMLLKPLHEELAKLRKGVDFKIHGSNSPRKVQALVLFGTGDIPAKADMTNHTHHTGYYSCLKCKIKGDRISGENFGNTHVFPYEKLKLRTSKEHERHASLAYNNSNELTYGVKGFSLLGRIMPDMITGIGIDVMHSVYLGIAKKLSELWLSSDARYAKFSLHNVKDIIESRLIKIKPPYSVKRQPRSIVEHANFWKATEWRSWFYFYSIPILQDLMKPVYFKHYLQLVHGIYLLNQTTISPHSIATAKKLLEAFVSNFETLYELRYMTINVHLLLHMADDVSNNGPGWALACFPFEDSLGKLLKYVHGTTHVGLQMYKKIAHSVIIPNMVNKLHNESSVKELCKEMLTTGKRVKVKQYIADKTFVIGQMIYLKEIPAFMKTLLENNNINTQNMNAWTFERLKKSTHTIYTKNYARGVSFISNCIKASGERVGFIKTFIKICHCNIPCDSNTCNARFFGLFEEAITSQPFVTPHKIVIEDGKFNEERNRLNATNSSRFPYLFEVNRNYGENGILAPQLLSIKEIEEVCFVININEKMYIGIPANSMEVE